MASKPPAPQSKLKKPPAPLVQTNMNGVKLGQPSSSPSSATKRLPGQTPTPTNIVNGANSANSSARTTRRPQRLTTRTNTTENANMERRATRKYPEPHVFSESHILKKFKGKAPSLIVHLHPTHFRFDQQDGSFSYQSEMRLFIEHLKKKTIPHDMLEEFRKSDVQFYDGWLIVRVVDHKSIAKAAASSSAISEDEKANSIHKHTPYITPSPYAPYPSKDNAPSGKSPPPKQESTSSSQKNADTIEVAARSSKPQPKVFTVALRPTNLSKHMDLVLDAMIPDPKALNRRQSQAYVGARAPGSATMAAPPTPMSNVPSTPGAEKGPPFKKQKLKIDPKDLLDYEAKVINATAPPLYLDAVDSLEEVQCLLTLLKDPLHDGEPPSPKSRKRTVAELAADDAHAKGQERFMQIMDERFATTANGGNGGVDTQGANTLFQPRFEKFIALDNIKKELAEKKKAEEARKVQDDENRQRVREDEQRRTENLQRQRVLQERQVRQQAAEAEANRRAQLELAKQQAMNQHLQQQQQQRQAQQQQQNHQPNLPNGVPPNMRTGQMIAQQSSPIIRQGSPMAKSSPLMVTTSQMGNSVPMSATGSNPGAAGSPPRPGSALQHGHPGVPMTRGPSNQGPSRNGTPQIPSSTPSMRHGTPVMRQGTPSQRMSQASPHGSMVAHTPQMGQAGMVMPGQIPNGPPLNPAQIATMNQRHALQQQAAAMAQQGIPNGNPMSGQAQMAHLQAQRHAQIDQQNALLHQQQQQQQQQMQQMVGTPQQNPSQSPAMQNASQAEQLAYRQELARRMQAQMTQNMQHGQHQNQGSPAPTQQQTPQQQHAAQVVHAQQQQQRQLAMQAVAAQQHGGQMPNGAPMPQMTAQQQQQRQIMQLPAFKQMYQKYYMNFLGQLTQKYGGNQQMIPREEQAQAQKAAQGKAMQYFVNQQNQMVQAQMRQNAQQQGHGGPSMQQMMAQQQHQQQQHQQQQHQQQMQMQGAGGQQQGGNQMQMAMMQAQAMQGIQMPMQNHGQGIQQGQGQGGPQGQSHAAMNSQASALASKAAYQAQLQQMLAMQNQGGQPR